jgi:Molybdate transporter of MFS superfamily
MTQSVAAPTTSPPAPRLAAFCSEAAASVADMGTFLPLAVGVSIACGLNFGVVLLCAGLANLYSGWQFRQPIIVQPMKVLCAAAIVGGWASAQVAASGVLMGIILLGLVCSGVVQWLSARVPPAMVSGIQFAAAAQLALKALQWLMGFRLSPFTPDLADALPLFGPDSLLLASLAMVAVAWPTKRAPGWTVLLIFAFGLVLAAIAPAPHAVTAVAKAPPLARHTVEWWPMFRTVAAQLPLTLLNSVIAVCALSEQYFPGQGIRPRRMATSVACINLLAPLAGGIPLCHGSGALAAVHRFGGRTGVAAILLGLAMAITGLLLAQPALHLLPRFPKSLLASLLITAASALALTAAKPLLRRPSHLMAALAVAMLLVYAQL